MEYHNFWLEKSQQQEDEEHEYDIFLEAYYDDIYKEEMEILNTYFYDYEF
jgi:hypothetical protein